MSLYQPFLTLCSQRDRLGNPILLLHSDSLPLSTSPTLSNEIQRQISTVKSQLPATGPLTLVYCHGSLAQQDNPSLLAVRAFRAAWEAHVPLNFRERISRIIALHVSFMTRSHIYASSFRMQAQEWSKLVYCDLLSDLEKELGVEPLLMGLRDHDFEYDEEMRIWVGRQNEDDPNRNETQIILDPSKPLINTQDVSFQWKEDNSSSNHAATPSNIEP